MSRQPHPHPEHRRRWLIWTLVAVPVALAAIAGGPWFYARFLAPDPAEPLALSTPGPTETAAPPVDEIEEVDGTWTVAAGSEAGYRLGEVLSGEQVTVVGRTDQVSGGVVLEDGSLLEAEVLVDVASIVTDESARDAYFRRALDTTTHPQATFEVTDPVDVTALEGATEAVTVQAPGTLTFHGVARPATAVLEVQPTGSDQVEVAGQIPVTLEDFDLTAPDLGFVTVEPTATVEMLLVLTR
ncbi:YceI family protein [Actinotalea sp. C106]|uniref:YceI family protein n=1 Tax=Actinotalea sp. C106 TaxID=2908644 RepID=UPI002028E195|nr:YceI family protein [Actinotalea sp. C106]